MIQRRVKLVHLLYAGAFLLALLVRLAGAGQTALNDSESALALQAFELSRGQAANVGPHPAYLALTSALMFLFEPTTWLARFWPALAGSLLVLLPLFFRNRLGKLPAVLLAFFLALDPGLLAVSVQANSFSLAIFFTLLALGLWLHRQVELTGIALGMALLSGPAFWPGLIGLGLAIWLAGGPLRRPQRTGSPDGEEPALGIGRRLLIFTLATLFFAGTLFFSIPNGLSAMAQSIPAYLRGWLPQEGGFTGAPLVLVLVGLLLYELFPLMFGLWGGLLGWLRGDPVDRFLLVWWAVALALALAYPSHQVQDLSWSMLPLWALSARQIARLAHMPAYDRLPALGQAMLSAVILAFISMTFISVVNNPASNTWEYWARLAGAIFMLVASAGLIAWGWSRSVALRGLTWGVGAVLFAYLVSTAWNAVELSNRPGAELWSGETRFNQADLLLDTLDDLEQQGPKITGGPDMVVSNVPSPALRWLLRDVQRASYTNQLPGDASPALVITPDQPELALSATYRGQGFILAEDTDWARLKPADWYRWLVFRTVPAEAVRQTRVILWARADFFPGGMQASSIEEQPETEQDRQ